jgi:glycosyltransferase involved in cell wall biosynthesis
MIYSFYYFAPSNSQILRGVNLANELSKYISVKEHYFYSVKLVKFRVWAIKNNYKSLKLLAEILQKIISKLYRLFKLKKAIKSSNIIHVQKRIDIKSLLKIEKYKMTTAKVLYDFDDAVWTDAFSERHYLKKIFDIADFVTCDNEFLGDFVLQNYNKKCHLLPPYYDQIGYYKKDKSSRETIKIGWLGSESTFHYMTSIEESMNNILKNNSNVTLCLAGVSEKRVMKLFKKHTSQIEVITRYNAEQMFTFLNDLDVGIFPCYNDDDSKGRGFLKLILYMSVGLPVVSSYNDFVIQIVHLSKNGFIVNSKLEWEKALQLLINDKYTRDTLGNYAFNYVAKNYSLNGNSKKIISLISDV